MQYIAGMDRDYKTVGCEYKRVSELYDHKEKKSITILKYDMIKINGDKKECEKLMKDDQKCGDVIVFKNGIVVDIDLFSEYIIEFKRYILNLLQNPFKYKKSLTDLKTKIDETTSMMNVISGKPLLEKKYKEYSNYKKQLLNQKTIQEKQEDKFKVDGLVCTLSVRTFIESYTFVDVQY
jgi:hypothetical protein